MRAAALVVGTVLLTGCAANGDGASTTLPSASAPTSETGDQLPALGPPDLPMPEDARAQTPDGARAFIEYFVEVYNDGQRTLKSTYLRQISLDCETCDALANGLDADNAEGNARQGGELIIEAISSPAVNGREAQAAFTLRQSAMVTTRDGVPVDGLSTPERDELSSGAILLWDDEAVSWRMTQLDVS